MKNKIKTYLSPLAAGAAAALLFMLFYALHGFYPFGERSVAWCDMDQQYVPLLMELKTALSDGSLLLGRGGGLMSFYGVFLFFLSSPLSLLSLAADNSQMIWFVNILLVIKAGLSSASAEYYFRRVLPKLDVSFSILMSVMYGVSGYVMMYYQNNMWLDMMIIFPLLMTALFRLMDSGKWGAYTICFAMCLLMNFYISFMVIIFTVMLGGAALHMCCDAGKRGDRAKKLLLGDICAALLSGVVWLPAFAQYTSSGRGNSLSEVYFGGYFIQRTFDKTALLSGSGLVFAAAVLLIVFRRSMASGRARFFAVGGLISFIGIFIEPVNKLLQTGSYQAYPLRYGFIVILLMFSACGALISERQEDKPSASAHIIPAAAAVLFSAAAAAAYIKRSSLSSYPHSLWVEPKDGLIITAVGLLGGAAYFAAVYSFRRGRTKKAFAVIVMAVLLFGESFMTFGINVAETEDVSAGFRSAYDTLERIDDEGFVRVKALRRYYYPNYAEAMGKYSTGHYTSLTDGDMLYTMKRLGYSSHWLDMDTSGGTMLTDELLLNRYIIGSSYGVNRFYRAYDVTGSLSVRTDPRVPDGAVISDVPPSELADFESCERMAATEFLSDRLFGEKGVVEELVPDTAEGLDITENNGSVTVKRLPDQPSELIYDIDVNGRRELYFDLFGRYSADVEEDYYYSAEVFVNDQLVLGNYPNGSCNGIIDLGTYEDETLSVRIRILKDFTAASFGLYLFDADRASDAIAAADTAVVKVSGSTLTAAADRGGYIYLPIAWSEGWSCTVNGEKAPLIKTIGSLSAVELPEGGGTAELRFCPGGLKPGAVLTAAGALLFAAALAVTGRKKRSVRAEKAAVKAVYGLSVCFAALFYAAAPVVWAVANIIFLIGG